VGEGEKRFPMDAGQASGRGDGAVYGSHSRSGGRPPNSERSSSTLIKSHLCSAALSLAGLVLGVSLMVTAASAKPPKPAPKASSATIAAGKKVYDSNACSACHAVNGAGGTSAPDLSKEGANPKHTEAWFEDAVLHPTKVKPGSKMPPYDGKINAKDIKTLAAYLGSLKGSAKPGGKM